MTIKTIHYFNPTCELAVANGSPFYQPPQLLANFEEALSSITVCFAKEGDYLVRKKPISNPLKTNLQMLGCANVYADKKENILNLLRSESLKVSLSPWGWSPALINYFKDFRPYIANTLPDLNFKVFYGRKNAISVLHKISKKHILKHLLPIALHPKPATTASEIEDALGMWKQIVLKAPLSSSGRGLLVIRKADLNQSNRQWITTILKSQEYIVVEPLLDKVVDLSFQYKISNQQVNYLGTTFFKTNSNGQYQGHYLNAIPEIMKKEAFRTINEAISELGHLIGNELAETTYKKHEGYLGVDALICKVDGQLMIHPCVEINPRNNMGIISMHLQKLIHPYASGFFQIFSERKNNYSAFEKEQTEKHQPKMKDGKLHEGFISLTEANEKQPFGAYITLGKLSSSR